MHCAPPLPLQEHIHQENARLEEEGTFWAKEIVVRIEYKYSPNLTLIDTPGALACSVVVLYRSVTINARGSHETQNMSMDQLAFMQKASSSQLTVIQNM